MKVLRKALARIVSGLLLFCAAQSAVGSLYDGKYGQYATFDVFRTEVNCLTQGATCGVYNFTSLTSPRSITGLEPFGRRETICSLSVGSGVLAPSET